MSTWARDADHTLLETSDLLPVLGEVQLRQGVEREGRERRQTNEVRLVLLGEVTVEPVEAWMNP